MPTARTLLDSALRGPMQEAGWTTKAAGWFTRPLTPECLAVVATGMATAHSAAGEGRTTAHLGLRIDPVEQAVASLCGMKDGGYKQRTTVVGLGYATSERRWLEWPVTVDSVSAVAEQIAATVAVSGLPYLHRLVSDENRLVAELPQVHSAVDLARRSVVLFRIGRPVEALQGLQEHVHGLGERADEAAVLMRETGVRVAEWVEQRSG